MYFQPIPKKVFFVSAELFSFSRFSAAIKSVAPFGKSLLSESSGKAEIGAWTSKTSPNSPYVKSLVSKL